MNPKKVLGYDLIAIMLALVFTALSLTGCPTDPADSPDPDPIRPEFTLINNGTEYSVTGYTGTSGAVIIPAMYNEKPVTAIGDYAFSGCKTLTSITISTNVATIGNEAFAYCSSLTGITVDNGNQNYASEGGILYNKSKTTLIQAPGAISGAVTIPEGVTEIGSKAFSECTSLTSITIPASVTAIGNEAFSRWTNSQTIYIEGHASQTEADAAWGTSWLLYSNAQPVYQGG
jgi:hypothetical protein